MKCLCGNKCDDVCFTCDECLEKRLEKFREIDEVGFRDFYQRLELRPDQIEQLKTRADVNYNLLRAKFNECKRHFLDKADCDKPIEMVNNKDGIYEQ